MPTPETPPSSAARPAFTARRILKSVLAILLTLACTLLLGLALVGWSPTAREAMAPLFSYSTQGVSGVALALTVAFILVTPAALLILLTRRRPLSWLGLALGWTLVLPAFIWLAWDDPTVRRSLAIEEISPAFDGAEKSYAVLMRYSKQHPSPEAQAFAGVKLSVPWSAAGPHEPEKWQEFLVKNRPGLEADWATLAPQRNWLAELNAFPRIADLAPARFDSNLITFQVWRTLSQRTCAMASQLALDGRGDDALATVLPMLEAGRKLEPSSRTLVRTMIAVVVQRMTQQTIVFILNRHTPSPALRERLTAALAKGNAAAGARRLVLLEYPAFFSVIPDRSRFSTTPLLSEVKSRITKPLELLSPFLFLPNATANLHGDHLYSLAALAEARELGKFSVRSQDIADSFARTQGPKNLGGKLLVVMATPSFDKVVRTHWEVEDDRAALLARVQALPH
ncbi:MAG: hypothetical protein HZA93_03680 [Verrucomicrobia bacterium]|nr:hypothetical protein [Verrucomicrobiota bacterium]